MIYLAANCGCSTRVGHWVADSYPENFKWVVSFQGSCPCRDTVALLAKATIKALDDLEPRCEVILKVSDDRFAAFVLGRIEGRIEGLSLATQEELFYQLERHSVTLEPLDSSRQSKAIVQRLEEQLA